MVKPSLIVFDIDGVLTDGHASLSASGIEQKRISFRDLDALTRLKRENVDIAFVTGETGALVDVLIARFGISRVIQAAKDKLSALQRLAEESQLSLANIWYIGDSDRDASALRAVGLGLAPSDGTLTARSAAHRVLRTEGGKGVAEEVESIWRNIEPDAATNFQSDLQRIVQDSIDAHQRLINDSLPILSQIANVLFTALNSGHKLMFFGNGGSAADAQHIAGEFVGRFLLESRPYAAIALTTDTSILTAVANDWDFNDVFQRQIRAIGHAGDVVIGISTSGNSSNILRGLEAGREIGATRIGFTGGAGGKMATSCDVCFCAPAAETPRIQELHILAWHAICELVEQALHRVDEPGT